MTGKTEPIPLTVLTGFMGTGKTAAGRALAEMLGVAFVDTDQLIEEREGLSVSDIFATKGEAHFRRCEAELCGSLADQTDLVVATGGGTLVNSQNLAALADRGRVVLLEASVDAIAQRVSADGSRPLLSGDPVAADSARTFEDRIRTILAERQHAYSKIPMRVDTTRIGARRVACLIAARLSIPGRTITIDVPEGSMRSGRSESTIVIGRGLLSRLGDQLEAVLGDSCRRSKVFVMIPSNVGDLHRDQIAASLDAASIEWTEIAIRDGDKEKTFDQAGHIVDTLARFGAARDSVALAVGGGVTGDLGGFAASIYMRGMPLVQVPTTLLAQVDASIGGKVGVNHPRVKNLVGAFHQPHLVLIDPCVLRTLTRAEISNGMAEVIKTAVLGSPALFEDLVQVVGASDSEALTDAEFLEKCVAECARIKATVVQRDPFERGERKVLNLGHTAGHALEAIGGYAGLTHGQAVSVGLVIAGRIAAGRGMWPRQRHDQTVALLAQCGLPVTAPAFRQEAFLQSLHLDKKKRDGRLTFVLPLAVGCCAVVQDVDDDEILAALAAD